MNPLEVLIPAVVTALTSPALFCEGVQVPVGEFFPLNYAGHYVEIDQPTNAEANACRATQDDSCTVLLNVVTQFPGPDVTSEPAETIVSQIMDRLRGKRLALPAGWDCEPATMEPTQQLKELDGELVAVRRLLRFRWTISLTPTL